MSLEDGIFISLSSRTFCGSQHLEAMMLEHIR